MSILRHLPRFRQAYRAMDALAARETWDREQISRYQLDKLNDIWSHAITYVPYYRDMHQSLRMPDRFTSLDEYQHTVPILTRDHLTTERCRLKSSRSFAGKWHLSGGSIGVPVSTFWPNSAHRQVLQARYRHRASWGLDIFDRCVYLWGHRHLHRTDVSGFIARSTEPVMDALRNRKRLSAYRLEESDLDTHLSQITKFRPKVIYGYSTAVFLLAQYAAEQNYRCDFLESLVLTAEPTSEYMKHTVESAFHAPVIVEYGSTECNFIGGSAPDGTLRFREDIVMMETVPRDDGRYDLVLSVLVNPAFPLLRYAIGDVTDYPISTPDRGFAIFNDISGRRNEFVITRTGRRIHPIWFMDLLELVRGIRRYQIVQDSSGSVQVRIEPCDAPHAIDIEPALRKVREKLEGLPVSIEWLPSIETTPAGKHRWIISELNANAHRTDEPCRIESPRSH